MAKELNPGKLVSILAVSILVPIGLWGSSQVAYAQARAYVANFGSNSVSVIDTSSNTVVATVGVGSQPNGVAITPDGTRAYVANGGGDVWVIDTSSNTVVAKVVVGSYPTGVAITPDGARAYVTRANGNSVSVIATSSNTVVATVGVGTGPVGVAITPDGTRAYVTNADSGTVSVIATSSNTVVATVGVVGVADSPVGVAITPDGTRAYVTIATNVTGAGNGAVSVIDTSSNTVVATVGVGSTPFGVAIKAGNGEPASYTCTNTTPPVITSIDSASAYGGYLYFTSGSWLEIKGTKLADQADPRLTAAINPGQWTSADFHGSNAPTVLDGVGVSINGKPAYVWYLSATQLNVQAPEDTATGNVAIMVTNCKATSSAFTFARRTLAPGFLAPSNYTAGGTQYMVATFASDGAYVLNTSTGASFGLNSRPAKPGDLIVAYGVGFGDVTPSILPGVIVGQSNALVNPITLSFGSTPATLSYSGLAGSFIGLYEFYITVPSTLANGDYQINVTQNGTAVPQTMYLTVHN